MQSFIAQFLDRFGRSISPKVRDLLLSNADTLKKAFVVDDYEVFEQIGDAIISQFIISYSYKKFPFLDCKEGVKVVARIRIKYTSSQFLSSLAESFGFWDQIISLNPNQIIDIKKQSLLEDTFEAFIGSIGHIIDQNIGSGVGYIACNHILTQIYDQTAIILTYENLFDSKTRLKELCDFFKQRLTISWKSEKTPVNTIKVTLTYTVDGASDFLTAFARTKVDAEQTIASEVLERLKIMGIKKDEPEIFAFLEQRKNDHVFKEK